MNSLVLIQRTYDMSQVANCFADKKVRTVPSYFDGAVTTIIVQIALSTLYLISMSLVLATSPLSMNAF